MVAVDHIRILPGHNARAAVGDVAELAASIRANGMLQALTLVELPCEEGSPLYGLVAGERRLTAARQIGLDEVPCLIRDLDERQRTIAMLVENLQRRDLEPVEEASGIQRLVAMGLSQRKIAEELGCSQSHVSKRLALLDLPEEVRSFVGLPSDSGGISVADALELTRLADHPHRLSEAFAEGCRGAYGGVAGAVRRHLRDLERERTVVEARSRLAAAGVTVLNEEPYYSWSSRAEKPLRGCGHDDQAIGIDADQHRDEPCHAAAIERDGRVVYVCRDPARHEAADPGAAHDQEVRRRQSEESRLRREAAERRRQAIAALLAAANTSHLPFAARQILTGWRVDECQVACQLLDVPPVQGRYPDALGEYAGRSMAAAVKAVLALALAGGEAIVTASWGGVTDRSRRHLELLVAAGYEPNEFDRKHVESP